MSPNALLYDLNKAFNSILNTQGTHCFIKVRIPFLKISLRFFLPVLPGTNNITSDDRYQKWSFYVLGFGTNWMVFWFDDFIILLVSLILLI